MTEDPDLSTLAGRCRFRRNQLGLSQSVLAAMAGYKSQSGITGIEDGSVRKPQNLLGLAAALGVRAAWLLDGEGPMADSQNRTEPVAAPEIPPPPRFHQWESRQGYQVIELRREMPTSFAIRLMDLILELDRFEAKQREIESRDG